MALDPLTAALEAGKILVEKIWPDPAKQAEEIRKLEELHQKGDLAALNSHTQLLLGQLEINKEEAKSGKLFIAGWRPAIGWIGAGSLGLIYIPKAIVLTAMWTYQCYLIFHSLPDTMTSEMVKGIVLPAFPDLGLSDILGLLGSMLGIGAMRSYDKINRVDTKQIK